MCLNCLNNHLELVVKNESHLNECLEETECECCKNYYEFLIAVNDDLKVLIKTKIKRNTVIDKTKVMHFEGMVKKRISNKLNFFIETLDNEKDDMSDGHYLSKMNEIKGVNDFVNSIEEADHN